MADTNFITHKRCTKCGETKEVAHFGKQASRKDGLNPHCKACKSADHKQWYERNREKKLAQNKAWADANRERGEADRLRASNPGQLKSN